MTPLDKSNPELGKIVDSLGDGRSLIWYDGEHLGIRYGVNNTPWIYAWVDGDNDRKGKSDTDTSVQRSAYFELDKDIFTTFKESLTPLREVLRMAKCVIVHDSYYVSFQKEGGRDEYALFSVEEYFQKFADCLPAEGHIFEYEEE